MDVDPILMRATLYVLIRSGLLEKDGNVWTIHPEACQVVEGIVHEYEDVGHHRPDPVVVRDQSLHV